MTLYRIEGIPGDMINPAKDLVTLEACLNVARLWREKPILYWALPLKLIDEHGNECDETGDPLVCPP